MRFLIVILAMAAMAWGQKGVPVGDINPVALKTIEVSIDDAKTVLMEQRLVPVKQPVYEMKTLTAKDSAGHDYEYQGLAPKLIGGVPVVKDTTVYRLPREVRYPKTEFIAGDVFQIIVLKNGEAVDAVKMEIPPVDKNKIVKFTIAIDAVSDIAAKK